MSKTDLIKLDNFYIKREDHNPTGSAKDRAMAYQLKNLINTGYQKAVISSTGNAAISASHFCRRHNINLTIFLSSKISSNKLKIIKKHQHNLVINPKPISSAFKFAKSEPAYFLRQSTDPSAITGYNQIGIEITEQLSKVTSIFIPVGSGATLVGISQKVPPHTKIFAVQPSNNPTITSRFDTNYVPQTTSLTDSLSAKYIPLKQQIMMAINRSNGGGLTISNQQIKQQLSYLSSKQIITSPESALALAGFKKAVDQHLDPGKYPLVIFTGTKR